MKGQPNMAHALPEDIKKRAEKAAADRPHLEIQDPGHVWTAPDGTVYVFVIDKPTSMPTWMRV